MDVLIVVIVNDIANVTHHIMNSITALIYIFTSMYSVYKCMFNRKVNYDKAPQLGQLIKFMSTLLKTKLREHRQMTR